MTASWSGMVHARLTASSVRPAAAADDSATLAAPAAAAAAAPAAAAAALLAWLIGCCLSVTSIVQS
jgi:hypothetical protein